MHPDVGVGTQLWVYAPNLGECRRVEKGDTPFPPAHSRKPRPTPGGWGWPWLGRAGAILWGKEWRGAWKAKTGRNRREGEGGMMLPNKHETMNTQDTATATATAPAKAKAKAKAPAPAPAPAIPPGWRVGTGGIPAKAAAQIDAALEAASLALGYPVATDEELNRLRSFAGRAAALAAEQGKGRVSGKGGTEAAARWDAKDVCARAGFPLHVLALGLALVKASADFRKAEDAE